jgi:DNA-binding transcriptional regulator GbsR (MarR family)
MVDHHDQVRPTHPDLQAAHDSMMQGLGQLADYFGYNRVMGELYATLLLHPGPMSLDELKERVHKSKASVSMNTRTLEYMGAVKEVWVREDNPSNRKYYEAESDLWKILSKLLGGRELKDVDLAIGIMEDNIITLRQSKTEMTGTDLELADFYISRMELLISFFRFARLLLMAILEKAEEMDISQVSEVELR